MHLTEIANVSQFTEYLTTMGIHKVPLEEIDERWEVRRNNEVVAMIQKHQSGRLRYYLNAHRLCAH